MYKIEIACDHHDAVTFCDWLKENGHDAKIGRSTGNYVDGSWTSQNDDAREILNALWDEYCNN